MKNEPRTEIGRIPWIAGLDPAIRDELLRRGRVRKLPERSWLWGEGDDETGLVAILNGALEIHAATADDREVLISLLPAGGVIGQSILFGGGPRLITAVSACPSEVFVVTDSILRETAARLPALWPALTRLMYDQLSTLLRGVTAFIADTPKTRLMAALLAYSRSGSVPVPLSQDKLAEMIGVTRVSVNGWLKELEHAGVIETGYREIRVASAAGLEDRLARPKTTP